MITVNNILSTGRRRYLLHFLNNSQLELWILNAKKFIVTMVYERCFESGFNWIRRSGFGSGFRKAKIGLQKGNNEEIPCLKSQNVHCKGLRRHMTVFDLKKIPIINLCSKFVIKNPGLDLYPDRIRIQQQAGYRSGFRKIPITEFGFSE
jgi:hypothetical protein